ncbi:MAG: endonuclease/exonuclease/phosphatase family protein, partial [Planctomycetota bacterium]
MTSGCAGPPRALHVATLNMAHGRGPTIIPIATRAGQFDANVDHMAEVLRRERPDIVALQEADAPSSWSGRFDHVRRLQRAAGFAHRYHGLHMDRAKLGMSLRYGTALLARQPLETPATHAFEAARLDAKGLVSARVELDGRPLLVASVHLDAKSRRKRRAQAGQLIDRMSAIGLPIVLLGDFNCQWNERSAVKLLVDRLDLQAYMPESSNWDTWPAGAPTRRIDWILISRELEFVDYRVWPDRVSDHLGVSAVLRWRN